MNREHRPSLSEPSERSGKGVEPEGARALMDGWSLRSTGDARTEGGGGLRGRRALGVRRSASPRAVSGPSEDSSVCEKTHARGRGQRHVSRRNQSVSLRSPAREQESGRIRLLDATELRRSTGPGDFCATEKDTDSSPSPRSLLESGLGAHALKREQPPNKKGDPRN